MNLVKTEKKIALFGDCIPLGTLSEWKISGHTVVYHTFRPDGGGNCILNKLSTKYNIDNFAQGHNGISYSGCAKPKWAESIDFKISTVYKICNNDLTKYDIILIFLGGNDFIHGKLGLPSDNNHETLYGALNIIKEKLNDFKGEVIWILPPYKFSTIKKFEFYLNILKKYTGDNYISFYDEYKHMIKSNTKILFPDNTHPSIICGEIMVEYVSNKLIEKIDLLTENGEKIDQN